MTNQCNGYSKARLSSFIQTHLQFTTKFSRQPNKRSKKATKSTAKKPLPMPVDDDDNDDDDDGVNVPTTQPIATLISVRVEYRGRLQSFRVPRGFVFGDLGESCFGMPHQPHTSHTLYQF
jgi:hypothetical protein